MTPPLAPATVDPGPAATVAATRAPRPTVIHPTSPTPSVLVADAAVAPAWFADFADPPAAFRPVPFWSWNESMDAAEVERQVGAIADAGWGGAFVHARAGLTIDYLGDAWFRAVDATLAASRTRGLKVWLYDEDKWPSGFSGGSVPLADERFRMRALVARRGAAPANCRPIARGGDGLVVHEWTAPLDNPWFNGTSYADLMNPDAVRRFLRDGYASYHDRYAGEYGRQIVAEFTDEPCTIFRLGLPRGAVPWSPELPDRFAQLHGYDPVPRLAQLFDDGPGAATFRIHYYRVVNDLFERNFTQQIAEWCGSRGIAMTGHYMSEHALYDQQLWGTKIMPNYRHQHVPGIDFLVRQVSETLPAKQVSSVANQFGKRRVISELYGVSGQNLSFEDRWWMACQQIALGVNVLNPHLALFTMAGCRKRDYPPNLFYQQPWWPLNAAVDVPLSRLCVAMSRGAYVAEALVLHPQESTFAAWRGLVAEDVAADHRDHEPTHAGVKERIATLDARFKETLDALLFAQRTFDVGDETILAQDADVDADGALRVGRSRYRVVILPEMWTIARATVALLERFLDAGGVVLRAGDPPTMLDGRPDDERLAALVARLTPVALDELGAWMPTPLVRLDGANAGRVLAHVRDLEDDGGRLVFLVNLDRARTFAGEACFDGPWRSAQALDPFAGASRDVAGAAVEPCGLRVDLTLAPAEAMLFVLSRRTGMPACPTAASRSDAFANTSASPAANGQAGMPVFRTADLAWSVERLDDNGLPLDRAAWREGDAPYSPHAVPVLAIQERLNALKYDGPIALRYTFAVGDLARGRKVHLVVEYPERYRISVNGTPVAYAGLPAWRDARWLPIDVTSLIRPGANAVELACDDFRHGDLTRHDDPAARYGTEIEAVYLVGDFHVSARVDADAPPNARWRADGLPPSGARWLDPASFALVEPRPLAAGDVIAQGLPFYAGRLRLRADVPASGRARRLSIGRLDAATATAHFDDAPLGTLVARPFDVALPAAAGTLELTLYGTLRNLLGPHHHPEGELSAVTPWSFAPTPALDADAVRAWGDTGTSPAGWDDRYCVVGFGRLD